MKRSERKIIETFNDDNMKIDPRFKRSLKENILKKANKPQGKPSNPFVYAAAGFAVIAVLFAVAQFMPSIVNEDVADKVAIPFTPKRASAAQLASLSKQAMDKAKSGDVPLVIRTEILKEGSLFAQCHDGLMGTQPGEVTEYYALKSKESDVEALYRVVRGETTRESSFYREDVSLLGGIIDYVIGHPFSLEDGYYTQVDQQGNPYSGELASRKEQDKNVFHVYAKATDGSEVCQDKPILVDFIVDADSYVLLETNRYSGTITEQNLISSYVSTLETRNLSEEQALSTMRKAGFDLEEAKGIIPDSLEL